jgi:hypothetical protein
MTATEVSEPPVTPSSASADLPANKAGDSLTVPEPLNETGTPKIRTKLRLYGILASLYVC